MGKTGKAKQQAWKEAWKEDAAREGWWVDKPGHDPKQRPWQPWRGSWGPSTSAGPHAGAGRYDQIELKPEPTGPKGGLMEALTPASEKPVALMQAIQKALTSSRKADARMRRLKEEKERREKQWQQWASEHKAAYFRQLKEFEADVARVTEEMNAAAVAGRTAADKITQLVAHGLPTEEAGPSGEAEDNSWEQFLGHDHDMEPQEGGYYQEALAATRFLRPTPAAPSPPVLQIRPEILQQLLLSVGGHLGSQPGPPPLTEGLPPPGQGFVQTYAADSSGHQGHVPPDGPTMPSMPGDKPDMDMPPPVYGPLLGPKDRRSSPLHPGQRDSGAPRVPTNLEAPRSNIKEATKAPPVPSEREKSIHAKLEAKRAAELGTVPGAALQPFRGGASGTGSVIPEGVKYTDLQTEEKGEPAPVSRTEAGLIDDDDRDPQHGHRSPGLDGLG